MLKDRIYQINCIIFKRIGESPKDIRFLLLKRQPEKGGFWQSITGGVYPKEDKIKALKRELQEEIGVKEIKKIIDTNYSFSFITDEGDTLHEYVFGIEIDPKQKISISKEHTKYKWVKLKEALKLLKYESNIKGFKILYKIKKNEKRN